MPCPWRVPAACRCSSLPRRGSRRPGRPENHRKRGSDLQEHGPSIGSRAGVPGAIWLSRRPTHGPIPGSDAASPRVDLADSGHLCPPARRAPGRIRPAHGHAPDVGAFLCRRRQCPRRDRRRGVDHGGRRAARRHPHGDRRRRLLADGGPARRPPSRHATRCGLSAAAARRQRAQARARAPSA